MEICVFLLGLVINGASSMIHTLTFLTTASSQLPGLPQYFSVGVLNNLVVTHYDSDTKRMEPKQEWMNRLTRDEPDFWETYTQVYSKYELMAKSDIETVLLNMTGGPHVLQYMQGCDWDEETDEIRVHLRNGFDGDDFMEFDFGTQTWVALKPQAFVLRLKWERGATLQYKDYFEDLCARFVKRFMRCGEKTLKRKELPLVWLLQKSSSSPVTCFASGFYPDRAVLFWAKDGEDLQGDWGEILPNHDGTFQSSVSLDLSSVPPGDWGRYSCVFQLSGVTDDLVTKLEPGRIRTNERNFTPYVVAAASVLGAVVCAVIGYFVFRRFKDKQLRPESTEPEVMQELNSHPPEAQ